MITYDEEFNGFEATNVVAPERELIKTRPIWLPSGAIRVFYQVTITRVTPPMRYVTEFGEGFWPGLDCSCQPINEQDIAECSRCLSVTCKKEHSFTCVLCGRVHCTGCRVIVRLENVDCWICKTCEQDLTTPRIIKYLKNCFG